MAKCCLRNLFNACGVWFFFFSLLQECKMMVFWSLLSYSFITHCWFLRQGNGGSWDVLSLNSLIFRFACLKKGLYSEADTNSFYRKETSSLVAFLHCALPFWAFSDWSLCFLQSNQTQRNARCQLCGRFPGQNSELYQARMTVCFSRETHQSFFHKAVSHFWNTYVIGG